MNTDKSFKSSHLKSKSQVFNFQIRVKLRVFSGPSLDDFDSTSQPGVRRVLTGERNIKFYGEQIEHRGETELLII